MKKEKANAIFSIVFLLFILILIAYRLNHSDAQNDLFNTQTLPEDELDALLLGRGIDASVIAYIPIWEKQYLIDCGVESVSFGDAMDGDGKESDGNTLRSDNFSMRILFARFQKEEAGEFYPCYRIIIPYGWKKLPVWTGSDGLRLIFDEKVWMPLSGDDVRQVDYVRKNGEIIKAIAVNYLESATAGDFTWGIDLKRKPGNVVRDGYTAITLQRGKKLEEGEDERMEIEVSYIHDVIWTKYKTVMRRTAMSRFEQGRNLIKIW